MKHQKIGPIPIEAPRYDNSTLLKPLLGLIPRVSTIFIIIILALMGTMGLLYVMKWGIDISSDSVSYINAAHNLLNGHGLSVLSGLRKFSSNGTLLIPLTHFPPLYPVLLAMIGVFGIDPLDGAKWLNATLFGVNILLIGLLINKYSRHSTRPTLFGSLLILCSVPMLQQHSTAHTEPAFIFFGLSGLALLAAYLRNSNRLFLIASSGAIGLAFLTRYSGATLIATGVLGVFLFSRKTYYSKVIDTLIFVTISALPMALWLIRNLWLTDNSTNRELIIHPVSLGYIRRRFAIILWEWLLPGIPPGIIDSIFLLSAIIGVVALSVFVIIRSQKRLNPTRSLKHYIVRTPPGLSLLLTFICIYVLFLIVSESFFDASIYLGSRILLPVYAPAIILVLCLVDELLFSTKGSRLHIYIKTIFIILGLTILGIYIYNSISWGFNMRHQGPQYISRKQSGILQRVRSLPPEISIFTDGPDLIYMLTNRPATMLPYKVNPLTEQINSAYLSQLAEVKNQAKDGGGVVVYINWYPRWYLPTEEELTEELPLQVLIREIDGTIYELNEETNSK